MRFAAFLLLGLLGCASSPSSPYYKDDQYLKFGVDPNQEADAVIESQRARDLVLASRQLGRHFTALSFMDKRGRSSAVRILTARGITVALDSRAQTPITPAATYALLAPPLEGTFDADKDGFEEVFVEERTRGDACVRPYRVRDVGFVDPIVVETRVWGQEVCPRAVIDLDGDGIVELVTEVELAGFPGLGETIRMPLPLWADRHRFVARAGSGPQRAWLAAERARREQELAQARGKLDVARSYLIGVELAALAYLGGGEPAGQLAEFDRALSGLVLSPPQAAANLSARHRIFTEWNDPISAPAPAAAPAPAPQAAPAAVAASDNDAQKRRLLEGLQASKAEPAEEPQRPQHGIQLRPIRRRGAAPLPEPEPGLRRRGAAPLPEPEPGPFWTQPRTQPQPQARPNPDEPVLADGEFIITPESAAAESARRKAARSRVSGPHSQPQPAAAASAPKAAPAATQTVRAASAAAPAPAPKATPATSPIGSAESAAGSTTPSAAPALAPDRAAARELGNAAFAARARAAQAREAAAEARKQAHEARLNAAKAPDAAAAAELRKAVEDHTATAQRLAEEAAIHAAEAAKHRDALQQLKAGASPTPPAQ